MRTPDTSSWHPASWTTRIAAQQPRYNDLAALESNVAALSRLPPLVVSWEIEQLRERLAEAQIGRKFLLMGGDCAETFEECESDKIAKKLKILLQMSLVLLHGLKKPIIRVGRMAGQYAKPRSADTETRNGVTLPAFRGEPGVLVYQLSRIASDGEKFVTFEKFRSDAAFGSHLELPATRMVVEHLLANSRTQPFQNGLHTLIEFAPLIREARRR